MPQLLFLPRIRSKRIPVNELQTSHESQSVAVCCALAARQCALAARRCTPTAQFGVGRGGFLCIKCANRPFLRAAGHRDRNSPRPIFGALFSDLRRFW
jgi:hypothetical protein